MQNQTQGKDKCGSSSDLEKCLLEKKIRNANILFILTYAVKGIHARLSPEAEAEYLMPDAFRPMAYMIH